MSREIIDLGENEDPHFPFSHFPRYPVKKSLNFPFWSHFATFRIEKRIYEPAEWEGFETLVGITFSWETWISASAPMNIYVKSS